MKFCVNILIALHFHNIADMYYVLLYYKITKIHHPDVEVKFHKEVCKALDLTGRILINEQGINGTVAGSQESIGLYKKYMNQHRLFKSIDFKESISQNLPFPKMKIKSRKEIITTDAKDEINLCQRGKHVDRDTFHKWLKEGEDIVLLDMRNDYEWEIGRFVGSIRPMMKYFRELKDTFGMYEEYKNKKIVMFCTGGVRCEPASAYFISKGFDPENLYQLEGGIVKYAEKYASEGFYEGKCFVFDERMALDIDPRVVGKCLHCQTASDTYRNCLNRHCNQLFIGCNKCVLLYENTCSDECKLVISDPKETRPMASNHIKIMHRNK